ncbi:MAG: hypothetical protein ACRDZ4_06135 [Egibacteraceae bacterium]
MPQPQGRKDLDGPTTHRVRPAERGQNARRAAGGGRALPTPGPGRHRRPGLPYPRRRDRDPRSGDRGAGRRPGDLTRAAGTRQDWAAAWAAAEIFGVDPAASNDDRVGRALDAVAPKLDGVIGSGGAAATAAFGVDVARLRWDMTSISLYGAYPEAEEGFVQPRYGHPKNRRPDLKQVQTGPAVTGDGGAPIFHRACDGGAGEVSQVTGATHALRELAGPRKFLLVGDSKLVSYTNLAAIVEQASTSSPQRRKPTWTPPPWPPKTSRRPRRWTAQPSATRTNRPRLAAPGGSSRTG